MTLDELLDRLSDDGVPPDQTLSKGGQKVTRAMAAGVAERVWSLTDIAGLLD